MKDVSLIKQKGGGGGKALKIVLDKKKGIQSQQHKNIFARLKLK